MTWHRRLHLACLLLSLSTGVAAAADPPPPQRPVKPNNPLDALAGSEDRWSVIKTADGCFLLSPVWVTQSWGGASRVAIGHAKDLGTGLFDIRFPFAVSSTSEPVPITMLLGGAARLLYGRMADTDLMFVPLTDAGVTAALQEVQTTSELLLTLHDTSILHSGQGGAQAVAEYRKSCAAAG
jgi:hypothetical protein